MQSWRQPIFRPFLSYFLLGLEKKVARLPAGTGEVKVYALLVFSRWGTKPIIRGSEL
jgi:hypothetical protein